MTATDLLDALGPILDASGATWRTQALCKGRTDDMYPESGDTRALRAAEAICRECPVAEECLEEALRIGDDNGVRAGMGPTARQRLRLQLGIPKLRDYERAPCGTVAGASGHRRRGEPTCPSCRAADAARMVQYRERRQARA